MELTASQQEMKLVTAAGGPPKCAIFMVGPACGEKCPILRMENFNGGHIGIQYYVFFCLPSTSSSLPHTSFEVKLTPNKMNKVNNWFKPWVSKSAFYSIQKERCYKRRRVFFSATQAVDTLFLIFQFIIEITNYFYIPWFILILRLSSCMILQGEKINLPEAHKIASSMDVIYHVHFIWANYTSIEQFMGPSTLFFFFFEGNMLFRMSTGDRCSPTKFKNRKKVEKQ